MKCIEIAAKPLGEREIAANSLDEARDGFCAAKADHETGLFQLDGSLFERWKVSARQFENSTGRIVGRGSGHGCLMR